SPPMVRSTCITSMRPAARSRPRKRSLQLRNSRFDAAPADAGLAVQFWRNARHELGRELERAAPARRRTRARRRGGAIVGPAAERALEVRLGLHIRSRIAISSY